MLIREFLHEKGIILEKTDHYIKYINNNQLDKFPKNEIFEFLIESEPLRHFFKVNLYKTANLNDQTH